MAKPSKPALARRANDKSAKYDDAPQPGALQKFDIELIALVSRADCAEIPFGVLVEVFKLSPHVRRHLVSIIGALWETEQGSRLWYQHAAALHEVCARAQRTEMLADAFILGPQAWRARHNPPAKHNPPAEAA
jgi:hypothetical protein